MIKSISFECVKNFSHFPTLATYSNIKWLEGQIETWYNGIGIKRGQIKGGNETRLGYVWYVQGIQPNVPAHTTLIDLKHCKYKQMIPTSCSFLGIRLCSNRQNTSLYHRTEAQKQGLAFVCEEKGVKLTKWVVNEVSSIASGDLQKYWKTDWFLRN